jgi:hypothetical protein
MQNRRVQIVDVQLVLDCVVTELAGHAVFDAMRVPGVFAAAEASAFRLLLRIAGWRPQRFRFFIALTL